MLQIIFEILHDYYGEQNWWPANDPFEIVVGSILTQNTNWRNVEKSIDALKKADVLFPDQILRLTDDQLQNLIYSSGFYKVKRKRLKSVCRLLVNEFDGSVEKMQSYDLSELRQLLLDTNGIGPETADDILLYAVGKPVFIIDTYTKRIFSRVGIGPSGDQYSDWQEFIMSNISENVDAYGEFHAHIVALAKERCKVKPICVGCPIFAYCSYARRESST